MSVLQRQLQENIIRNKDNKKKLRELVHEYYTYYLMDSFLINYYSRIMDIEPKVLVVGLDFDKDDLLRFAQIIKENPYSNLELTALMDNSLEDLRNIMASNDSEYVIFVEKSVRKISPGRIAESVLSIETSADDMVLCYRNFLTEEGNEILDISMDYWKELERKSFVGKDFLKTCENNRLNLYGSLSTVIIKRQTLMRVLESYKQNDIGKPRERMKFLFSLISAGIIHFIKGVHVTQAFVPYDALLYEERTKKSYKNIVPKDIEREITFIYTDRGEYYNVYPIAKEAERRGYKVIFTEDVHQKAQIGIYCQHDCFPENAKFSVVLLHDMAQKHNRWPNIWMYEHWDKFDIGILPGEEWAKRWAECAAVSYARPRFGAYMLGYPKSDILMSDEIINKAAKIKEGFKHDFTVLYAPSWENDGKEDDFIRACHDLPINMLVKQASVSEQELQKTGWNPFRIHFESVNEMRRAHEGKYANLTYVEPEENILTAIAACDLLVSDESSVMTEATLFKKPSISVCDWLIPDTLPRRPASVPMSYVAKCKKAELRETVLKMMNDKFFYEHIKSLGENFFANKGNCSKDIMNLIEQLVYKGKISERLKQSRILPKYMPIEMWS